jgi:hypothetical protein
MSLDPESLQVKLDAYKEFNQPDELATDQVGSSFDAIEAVRGVINTVEGRKACDRSEQLNQQFVTSIIAALPETNRVLDIQKPDDLVLARHIQANTLWYSYNQVSVGQYIAGIKTNGEQTSVLLVPQTRQELYDADDYDEHETYTYPMPAYCIHTFLTDEFEFVMARAKEREVMPFTREELMAMNRDKSHKELQVELDGKSPSSIRMWQDNGFSKPAPIRRRVMNKILGDTTTRSHTALNIVGYERVDSERLSDQVLKDFHVLDRIVELAVLFGSVQQVQAKISSAEQK